MLVGSFALMQAQTGTITTYAGTGVTGSGGDGGLAINAQFNAIDHLVQDANGNLYISEYYGNRVRKIDAATGIISTVAGNGTRGFGGIGGLATAAQLYEPTGVAFDAAGNMYIGEYGGSRVLKVDAATGIITNMGAGPRGYAGDGGALSTAQFNVISDLFIDPAGNLFITDAWSTRIRKVTVVDGVIDGTDIIQTIAGTGVAGFSGDGGLATAAQLNHPNGMAMNAAGDLFFSSQNHVVRKIDAVSGIISSIAGTGTAGYGGDNGPATAALLNVPHGISFDQLENLFIADINTHRVRKIDAVTQVITTVAGTGTAGFSGDGGPATAAQLQLPIGAFMELATGDLYIGEASPSNRVRKVEGIGATLPVELLSFDASTEKAGVRLRWTTATELNNDFFSLERSLDNQYFTVLATEKGAGNSDQLRSYQFLDNLPFFGTNYYRLRQTDFDGQFRYSAVVEVNWGDLDELVWVYPNPVGQELRLVLPAATEPYRAVPLQLYSLTGQVLLTIEQVPVNRTVRLRFEDYPAGIYWLKVHNPLTGKSSIHKVIH